MLRRLLIGCVLLTQALSAQMLMAQTGSTNVAQRVGEDAIVLDRVAQASKRDLPADLLKRIVDEDIDLLRGKRSDGTYEHATFERFESGRVERSFSIKPRKDEMETVELKGEWIYRVQLEIPGRKLLVRKNRPVWVERIDLEYIGERSSQVERQTVEIKQWLQPGEFRPADLPVVARQVTARVVAAAEPEGGYANINVILIKARIVDNVDSPYADAVASAKAIQRALENRDVASIRAMAQRMRGTLLPRSESQAYVPPSAPPTLRPATPAPAAADPASRLEIQTELQLIEDLLTGSESEKREGMDRLHQMLRRLRQ